jgi:hypothetical protein
MKEYPHNVVIRIGEGQSPSGEILDWETHWYNLASYEEAIQDAENRHRNIYISINNQKYQRVKPELLAKFAKEKLEKTKS